VKCFHSIFKELLCCFEFFRSSFETQQFAPEFTHVNQLVLSKSLTSLVQSFFKTNHPDIFRRIKDFCQMKVKHHKQQQGQDKSYFKEYQQADRSNPEKRVQRNANEVVLRQARQQRIADDAVAGVRNPDQPLLWETVDIQNPNQFINAHTNPNLSLVLFLYNSGHSYLPPLENNVLPHSSVCPDIMSETWNQDSQLPRSVTQLHQALLNLEVTPQIIEERVAQFKDRIKLNGVLPACASCGIRYCLVSEDDLADSGRARPSHCDDPTDSFRLKPEPQRFIRLGLDNPLFQTLRLTDELIK
jgi:hypothetical protein